MVRAFLLLALGGPGSGPGHAPGHAPCRVLLARAFAPPGTPPGTPPGSPPRQRLRRKEQLLAVARQVASHCHLHQASSGRPPAPPLAEDPPSLHNAPGGLFRLPPGDPFPQGTSVAWLAAPNLAFALVCDPRENLALAEGTLRHLAPRLLAALRPPGTGVLLRPDAADLLLDRLLPHGQLLFLSERFLQAADRELSR
ncbi:AP-5 complex subunit sigma-1 [Cygnus atratus]|uniref:AP-5 complex subunit sigma-1 n=1 Tax=Cygnus atratus TaxID=8868 RepID=UPI0015D6318B|nr:AP-5 complex subunit sigma-1 [Cygnus atratus]